MSDLKLRTLYLEKTRLLNEWPNTSGQNKIRTLIRLMELDDQISKIDGGGEGRELGGRQHQKVSSLF